MSLHENYDKLPADVRAKVDRAFNEAMHELRSSGLDTSTTDHAERLVDAIARYVIVSNPDKSTGWEMTAAANRAVEEAPPVVCSNCGGDGYAEDETSAVCSVCHGRGYISFAEHTRRQYARARAFDPGAPI